MSTWSRLPDVEAVGGGVEADVGREPLVVEPSERATGR